MPEPIRFNCGEFLPGREAITGGGVITTVPPIHVPAPPRVQPAPIFTPGKPRPPGSPPGPGRPIPPIPQTKTPPPPGGPSTPTRLPPIPQPKIPPPGGPSTPTRLPPIPQPKIPPPPPGGPITPRPLLTPPDPIRGTDPRLPPTTIRTAFKCSVVIRYCINRPGVIQSYKRDCIQCATPPLGQPFEQGCIYSSRENCIAGIGFDGVRRDPCANSTVPGEPCVIQPQGNGRDPTENPLRNTITTTQTPSVVAGTFPGVLNPILVNPAGIFTEPPRNTVTSNPANTVGIFTNPTEPPRNTVTSNPANTVSVFPNTAGTVVQSTQAVLQSTIVNLQNEGTQQPSFVIDANNEELRRRVSSASSNSSDANNRNLFHPTFNFFKTQAEASTILVVNSILPTIFNTVVCKEVKYFLDRINTPLPWSEYAIHNLTSDKIAISISPQLLSAFRRIHHLGNLPVDLNYFLGMIQKSLMTGRIAELDPNYYISLAERQLNDTRLVIIKPNSEEVAKQAALGLISIGASSSDFRDYNNKFFSNQIKRQRRLNTDIEATIQFTQFEGITEPLPVNDYGIDTLLLDSGGVFISSGVSAIMNIGDGEGYYISAIRYTGEEIALLATTQISSSYYVPPDLRFNVMNLMGLNPGITLTTESQTNNHEFSSSFDYARDLTPMYFKLDLETVGDLERPNSLVDSVTGTYVRVTDEEAIEHSRNYALNITKVNLDFRDPFIHYAMDSSSINLQQYDMTFRSFDLNRTTVGQNIITRNIPFGIILTPGCGPYHNPFNGESILTQFDTPTLRRSISLIPDIRITNKELSKTQLDEKILNEEIGGYSFGLYENLNYQDAQNIIYRYNPSSDYFSKSYYTSAGYTPQQPGIENRVKSFESQLVLDIVDFLITTYTVRDLTWWDIFRRLKIHQIGGLMFSTQKGLFDKLASGWRGVPVRDVLSRLDKRETGIDTDALDASDTIIINESDRLNAQIY